MRRSLLVVVGCLACAAGSSRETGATSLSVGESTGSTATGTTASSTASESSGAADTTGSDPDGTTDADSSSGGGTTGAPSSCADDEAACNAWFLPRGAAAWEPVTIGGPPALAPAGPVLAAFDIEAEHIAFLLTADEVVRVDLDARTWVSKTTFVDRFPETNVDVLAAYSIPAYQSGMPNAPEGITIAGNSVAFLYEYDAATDVFAFDQSTVFGDEWNGPAAPDESTVREWWIDLTNADGWVDNDVSEICDNGRGPVGPHITIVTDAEVYVEEAGYCFDFFPAVAYSAYAPFGLAGAPPLERIGGIAYNETTGLVVFASE